MTQKVLALNDTRKTHLTSASLCPPSYLPCYLNMTPKAYWRMNYMTEMAIKYLILNYFATEVEEN